MWNLDEMLLARIQFGFTISFHIIFPAITIGLASYLALLEASLLRTGQEVFRELYHFWSRILILLGVLALYARWRGTLYRSRPLLHFAQCIGPAGIIAILAGWLTTEIGRQPWITYGVMRTTDGVSLRGAGQLGLTLASVLALGVVAYDLRLLMRAVGMSL